jgi:hypothetical protein
MQLNPVSFTWKKDAATMDGTPDPRAGTNDIGFIAQEVEKVLPGVVTENKGTKAVDYVKLVPVLVKAMQEQQKEIEALKSRVEALEK